MTTNILLTNLIERFFVDRLINQMEVSLHTRYSYRDTFKLLLCYALKTLQKQPSELMLSDISADFINSFLIDLEQNRGISARSRNVRLAAIRSFFHYISFQEPQAGVIINQVLSIPNKKCNKKLITYLTDDEVKGLMDVIDQRSWFGRRDKTLITIAVETGMRLTEITELKWGNFRLDSSGEVKCTGKGRKERIIPISPQVVKMLSQWSKEIDNTENAYVFPTKEGNRMSSDNFQRIMKKYYNLAIKKVPSLKNKKISPHILRHTAAMRLVESNVDLSVIALLLGHNSIDTTLIYIEATTKMKEEALKKLPQIKGNIGRIKPSHKIFEFLRNL